LGFGRLGVVDGWHDIFAVGGGGGLVVDDFRNCVWPCSFGQRFACPQLLCVYRSGFHLQPHLRVQPLQLQEVVPSAYCRVSYSMLGFESEAKLQTWVICLFMFGQGSVLGFQPGKAGNEDD
jgi:hypothetical protein